MQFIGQKRLRSPSPKRVRFCESIKSYTTCVPLKLSQNDAIIQEIIDNLMQARINRNLLLVEVLMMKLSDLLLNHIYKMGLYAIIDTLLSEFVASYHLILKIIDVAFYYGELDIEFYYPSFGIFEALLRGNKKNYMSLLFIRAKDLFALLPIFHKKCSFLSNCIDFIYAKFILWLPKNIDVRGYHQIIIDFAYSISYDKQEEFSYFSYTLDAIKYLFDLPGSNHYRLLFLKKLTQSFFKVERFYLQRVSSLLEFLAIAEEKIVLQNMLYQYLAVVKEKRYSPCLESFEYNERPSEDMMKKLISYNGKEYNFIHFLDSFI